MHSPNRDEEGSVLPGFQVTETIERSPDEVWAVLSDLAQAPRWMNAVTAIEPVGGGALEAGTRLRTVSRVGRKTLERDGELAAWAPPESLALKSTQGGVTAVYRYDCRPDGPDRTRVTLTASCTTSGLLWRALGPLIAVLMKRNDGGQLASLKALIEAQPRGQESG